MPQYYNKRTKYPKVFIKKNGTTGRDRLHHHQRLGAGHSTFGTVIGSPYNPMNIFRILFGGVAGTHGIKYCPMRVIA